MKSGPQTLTEGIKEVEKLQSHTANNFHTVYPPHWSTLCPVIMTGVFNVKKSAIWHAIALTYGATTLIIMDMLPWTAWIRYHCLAHQHTTEVIPTTGVIDPPLDIIATPDVLTVITRIDPGSVTPDPTHITIGIGVAAIMTPIGATPGHSTDLPDIVSHTTEAQVPTAIATDTLHCSSFTP